MLALSFDMSLACATANRPEDEPALKRSLWLTIARHIVQQHPSQDQVTHITPPPIPLIPPLYSQKEAQINRFSLVTLKSVVLSFLFYFHPCYHILLFTAE